ncbi:MAG: hypothetical protein K2N63_00625 [Lachnospiraceae bacterium]|nr:hypothetical protein [Lachnospiraceae bacterium]
MLENTKNMFFRMESEMRDSLLKIYVDRANFEISNTYGGGEITYLAKSDDLMITPFDFIVIVDTSKIQGEGSENSGISEIKNESGQVLRNCYKICENLLSYTSILVSGTRNPIALYVVAANLYEGIQHIRHGAPIKHIRFWDKFPFDMVKAELIRIKLCISLLEGKMDVKGYQKEMEEWSELVDGYFLESTNAILTEYPWEFRGGLVKRAALDAIKSAVADMEKCMQGGMGLEEIGRLAYKVHNEPQKILMDNSY